MNASSGWGEWPSVSVRFGMRENYLPTLIKQGGIRPRPGGPSTNGFNCAGGQGLLGTQNNECCTMTSFSSLRIRLVGTVFVAIVPVLVVMYFTGTLDWAPFLIGLLALAAAWFGGELFVLRQVRALLKAPQQLAAGDLTIRTGMADDPSELGQLARTFDALSDSLRQRDRDRDAAGRAMLNRALQQTAVAALGQFALVTSDLQGLFNQAVVLVTQTLETEFCQILELLPEHDEMILRAGAGWKEDCVGNARVKADSASQEGYTLGKGEPVVVGDLRAEARFQPSPLLRNHRVVSGITVVISTRHGPRGILGAHTARARTFTGEEVHFLLAVATALALAIERIQAEAALQKLAAFTQLNPNPALELAPDATA